MKCQVIQDFNDYIKAKNIGHNVEYSKILHKISFIQNYSSFDNLDSIYEFLTNN